MAHFAQLQLDPISETPIYRQLASAIEQSIQSGAIQRGERLPATRELAGRLGLNRTTVSAAYALLEQSGLLEGQVGRGSFVAQGKPARESRLLSLNWDTFFPPLETPETFGEAEISFATSRPSEEAFPMPQFRQLAREVIESPEAADILQLGSPLGYPPLRRYLLEEAKKAGVARSGDDLIVTNGCQQALDLLARIFVSNGTPVLLEDPVYHGLLRVFSRAGALVIPVPVGHEGIDPASVEALVAQQRPRLLVVTPSFQNPTGATLNLAARKQLLEIARRNQLILIESDIYSQLRYTGPPVPRLKQLDEAGDTILLGSYSKVAFPGLRVGWVIAPGPVIARLAEAKQISDLHSDQLAQAVLLRFAESGELERHVERTRHAGAERLNAAVEACVRYLPAGARFTRPEGGMSLWVELPAPLNAEAVLRGSAERGVAFLPGSYFSLGRSHKRGLRISFGGLSPAAITRGLQIIGEVARREWALHLAHTGLEPVAALV